MRTMFKRHLLVPAVVFVGTVCFFPLSCTQKRAEEKSPVTVSVISVGSSSSCSGDVYVGQVCASRSAVVTAPYGGTLVSSSVSQGDRVKASQELAKVESSGVQSSYEMACATLRQAEDGYQRLSKVYGSGSVADVKMVEMQTNLEKARAAEASARKAVEDCTLKAPFSGVVGEIYAEEGEQLMVSAPVVKIVDVNSLQIKIPVPEGEISSLNIGRKAYMSVPAVSLKDVPLRLVRKGVVASSLAHTYECVLEPLSFVPSLMSGMVCKVTFEDKDVRSRMLVPASVVRTDMQGRYVWTVDEDDIVHKVFVKVDGFSGDGVVISEGLSDGDRVIVDGVSRVSTGMKVKTVEKQFADDGRVR